MEDETRNVTVFSVTLMIVDHDRIGADGVRQVLEGARYSNRCISPLVIHTEAREVEWHERHPLNLRDATHAAFDALFRESVRP